MNALLIICNPIKVKTFYCGFNLAISSTHDTALIYGRN